MALELMDIKCFYNHKKYPISLRISKPKNVKYMLDPGQELKDSSGRYIVSDSLFDRAKIGLIMYREKNIVDKLIKEETVELVDETVEEKAKETVILSEEEKIVPKKKISINKKNLKKTNG